MPSAHGRDRNSMWCGVWDGQVEPGGCLTCKWTMDGVLSFRCSVWNHGRSRRRRRGGRYDLELDRFAMLSTHTRGPWDGMDAVRDGREGRNTGLRVLFSILIILVPMKLIWMTTARSECEAVGWMVGRLISRARAVGCCRERGG